MCPFNQRFGETGDPAYAARGPGERPEGVEPLRGEDVSASAHPGTEAPSLVALMRMTREEWDVWTRGSSIRRAGYAGFRRNLAVAMGNWLASVDDAPADAVAVLREALHDESELVREHARWALASSGSTQVDPLP